MHKKNSEICFNEGNVVLNFHKKDQHSAKSMLKLLMAVEEGRSCKYYLQYGDDESTIVIGDIISKFLQCKNAEFSNKLPHVKIPDDFIYNDPNTFSYVGNHAVRSREQKKAILQWNLCVFKYIQKLDDFLIIEPDCVILANNWIKNIYKEYQKYDYPIFGHLKKGKIKGSLVPTHWAGCSIYNGRELRKLPLYKYFSNRYDNPWWRYRNDVNTTNENNAFYGPIFSGYDISYDYFLFALYWKDKTGSNNPYDWPVKTLVDRSDLIFCDFRSTLAPDVIMTRFAGKLSMMHGVKDDEIRDRMLDYFSQAKAKENVKPACQISKVLGNQCYSDELIEPEIDEEKIVAISNTKLVGYKNRHKGQRCVIIGNGPSLNKMDLSFLENEITFGTNRIYLLFNRWKFRLTYYASVNPLVLEQSASEILKIKAPKFLSNKGIMFFPNPPKDLMFIKSLPKWYFSRDPREGLCEGWTVTYFAMQLAYFMGFSEVILIGVDHFFMTQGDPNKEVVSQGADPNHFHPEYFGKGIRWHLPDLKRSEGSYEMAKKAFEADGRRIVDATVGGKLDVFPKVDYRQYFSAKNVVPLSEAACSPNSLQVLKQAQELADRGQINAAIKLVHKTCRLLPNDAPLHFALGLLLEKRGEKRVAVSYFESAVKFAPDNMNYLKKLAFCYHKTCGRSGEALSLLQKVIEIDNNDHSTYQAVAQICQSVGRQDDAAYFNEIAQRLSDSVAITN
jgi:tetratricopeptide (TPR) repeat protein